MTDAPMPPEQITSVIESILDDHLGDSEPPNRHREVAESLTESWLKDRRRAVSQALEEAKPDPPGHSYDGCGACITMREWEIKRHPLRVVTVQAVTGSAPYPEKPEAGR